MWDLKLDTRRLADGFSTSVLWERPDVLWNKADDWWNDNYVTDSNTAAFLSATGIIDPNKQNYVNNLVIALKNQGLWNKAKAIYPFVSEQRNLLNYTEDFSNSYWQVLGGALKSPNYAAAPNGTTTGCRVYNGGALQTAGISKEIGTYVLSFYVKMTAGGTGTLRVFLDGGVTTTVVNVTASWTRVQVSKTFATVDSGTVGFFVDSDVLIWGPQFELGSTATDYQVTINAQEQFAAAYKYNLKDPQDTDAAFRLKIFGTWTFTPTGAKPNGTNAYMDTNMPSNTMSNGSTHLSYYSRTDSAANSIEMGTESPDFLLWYKAFGFTRANFGVSMDYLPVLSNTKGFLLGSRYTSTNGLIQFNSNQQLKTGLSGDSRSTLKIYLGALNASGTSANYYSSKQTAFATIGDGLNDAEAAALYTIVQQFQTSMARQV
jgi:hypothetical protein